MLFFKKDIAIKKDHMTCTRCGLLVKNNGQFPEEEVGHCQFYEDTARYGHLTGILWGSERIVAQKCKEFIVNETDMPFGDFIQWRTQVASLRVQRKNERTNRRIEQILFVFALIGCVTGILQVISFK